MTENPSSRRRFLAAALALAGTAAAYGPITLLAGRAWAAAAPGEPSRAELLRVVRLMYPHRGLGDEVYAEVLDQALVLVAGDAGFDDLLRDAELALDGKGPGSFYEATPEAQLAALAAIDRNAYWAPIQAALASRLYSHPEAWAILGYEGPSWRLGGYVDRGSGDIDWLPESGS